MKHLEMGLRGQIFDRPVLIFFIIMSFGSSIFVPLDNFQIAQSHFFYATTASGKKMWHGFFISKIIATFLSCNQFEAPKTVYNAILVSKTSLIWLKIVKFTLGLQFRPIFI